mmetsp:Transcript_97081/g.259386  ORF Transcript_97081/g.259386 Transcript_97081/m.259386 type:complete len:336 (-) Transcript_97081:258-1265(-)
MDTSSNAPADDQAHMVDLSAQADPWAAHETPEAEDLDFGMGAEDAAPEQVQDDEEEEVAEKEPDPMADIPWDVAPDKPVGDKQSAAASGAAEGSGKVLLVLTNTKEAAGKPTGFDPLQCARVYQALIRQGFSVMWASPEGGLVTADASAAAEAAEDECFASWTADAGVAEALKATAKLEDVDPSYCLLDAVLFLGGRGALYDFVSHNEVRRIAREMWEQNKVVAALDRGSVALAGVILEDGTSLVEGKEVTGASNDEEDAAGDSAGLPVTVEEALEEAGAGYKKGLDFEPNVAVTGRLITGQNTASAKIVADAIVGIVSNPDDANVWAQFVAVSA